MRRRAILFVLFLSSWPMASLAASTPDMFAHPKSIGAFSLLDQHGHAFTNDRLRGRWSLIDIGYTSCPDVCPFTLGNLAAVYDRMAKRVAAEALPQVVFVSVDPQRDQARLGPYVASFQPAFLGVTGAPDQLQALASGIGAFFRINTPDAHGSYTVDHTSFVAIVGPDGTLRGRMTPPFDPDKTAAILIGLAGAERKGMP